MKNKMNILITLVLLVGLAFSFGQYSHASSLPNVDFIDVSHHNNEDGLPLAFYQTIKAGGVKGVVVKVSEGEYYVDPAASVNIANARQAGLIVNAYHFARFNSNDAALNEAKWFDKKLQLVGFDKNKDGYVVVDVEDPSLSKNPLYLTEYTNTFINEMKSLGYERIDLYTGSYFYNNHLSPRALDVAKPWIASYPSNPVKGNVPVKSAGAWQWSENYSFIGMSNYGHFDVSEDYAGKYTVKTAPTQKVTKTVGTIQNISLVNYMVSKHMDPSYKNRAKLADAYGITNYQGTAAQNLALISKLKSGVKPAKTNTSNSKLTTKSSPVSKSPVKKVPAKPKYILYIIKKGDTLSGIAVEFHTSVSKIKSINHLRSDLIFPKQKLQIK